MTYIELLPPSEATPGNPRWHELRRQGVTASEIAAVLGISPWQSPFSLYWQKVNGWVQDDNDDMAAGRRAEPVIAQWFAEQDPDVCVFPAGLYGSVQRPWQLATPDRLVDRLAERQLLECKYLVGGWDGWGEPGTDDVPVYYRAQCLWQADVLDVDTVYLAAWHRAEFRCYVIRCDAKDVRVMRAAGEAFMERVAARQPPPVDGHGATLGALKRLHPSIVERDVSVPVEFAEGWRRARALRRQAEEVESRYQARARMMLGDGHRLVCNGHLVASRSIWEQTDDMAELDALDTDWSTVDRLNPGRAATYLIPKGRR